MADPSDRHHINPAANPAETITWLTERGYKAVLVGIPEYGDIGIIYSTGDEPPKLAVTGQTLLDVSGHVGTLVERRWVRRGFDVSETLDWIEKRGYRNEPDPSGPLDQLRLVREGHPTLTFRPGAILFWDGHTLTVEET